MKGDTERELVGLRCPSCGRAFVWLGGRDINIGEPGFHRTHAYWCPGGCRGTEPDGTFEFVECPVCGSHDTSIGLHTDGLEEVECNVCGVIASLPLAP
jgi:ribosomal protein S27E